MTAPLNESATPRMCRRTEFWDNGRTGCPPAGVGSEGRTDDPGCSGGKSRNYRVFSCGVSYVPHQ